jgi:hypothetical protein
MYKNVTNQTRTFQIQGGGGTSSSFGISAPSGYNFSVSNFNKIPTQTAQRHYVRRSCFFYSGTGASAPLYHVREERRASARGALPRVTARHCERSEAIQFKPILRIRQQTASQFKSRARYLQDALSSHPVSIHWPQLNIIGNSPHMRCTQGLVLYVTCEAAKGR